MNTIDHIVLVADELNNGRLFVEERLGVTPTPWCRNDRYGTHSLALRLGNHAYLEVMAADPDADPPPQPRWYELDDPHMQRTLARRPRLFGWAVRVTSLAAAVDNAAYDAGIPLSVIQGGISWKQTQRPDGQLILSGAGPALVERSLAAHPASQMPDQGCRIAVLRVSDGKPAEMQHLLASIGADTLVEISRGNGGERRIEVEVETPSGVRLLL